MCPNDEDIKIFHPSRDENDGADLVELASMTDFQRRSGNTAKAKQLGEHLARIEPSFMADYGCDFSELENNELYQVRVLMIFAFQISLHRYMPNSVLSSEAINAMFNTLKDTSEGFFFNISDGSSFTFYYLSVRKNREVDLNIGKNFAMLCERDDDEEYILLGTKIFTSMCAFVCDTIEKYEFIE